MKSYARALFIASAGVAVLCGASNNALAGGIVISPTTIGSTGDPIYFYDFTLYLAPGSVLSYGQNAGPKVTDHLTVDKLAEVQYTTVNGNIAPATYLPSSPTGPWTASAVKDGSGLDLTFHYFGAIIDNSAGKSNLYLGDFIVYTTVNTATATAAQKALLTQVYNYTSTTTLKTTNPTTYTTGAVQWGISQTQATFATPEPSTFALCAAAIPAGLLMVWRYRRTA